MTRPAQEFPINADYTATIQDVLIQDEILRGHYMMTRTIILAFRDFFFNYLPLFLKYVERRNVHKHKCSTLL